MAGAAAAAILACSHAAAVTTGTVTIGNYTFTLFDLNPNDNIAPALSFTGMPSNTYVQVGSVSDSDSDSAVGAHTPINSSASGLQGSGSAQVTAASGTANLSAAAVTGSFYAYAYVSASSTLPVPVPVPEPGAWALMLAGLAGVGFFARRKRGG